MKIYVKFSVRLQNSNFCFDLANPLNMPNIIRMQKVNRQNNDFIQMPMLIVKFVAAHIRNAFYGLYLSKATKDPILSEHLGLAQGSTIRIGEILTSQNQLIFTKAIKLKRDKKLLKVNTVDGLIRVKCQQTERFVIIRSKRELEQYVASQSSALSSAPPLLQTVTKTSTSLNLA